MLTCDDFSTCVADLLSGTYDCVDRISLRGYFLLGQTSGGLLTWWNQLFPNTELSEARLRKLAGDFAWRVHGYARKHQIPLRYFERFHTPNTETRRLIFGRYDKHVGFCFWIVIQENNFGRLQRVFPLCRSIGEIRLVAVSSKNSGFG